VVKASEPARSKPRSARKPRKVSEATARSDQPALSRFSIPVLAVVNVPKGI